ncbi:MAG: N-6 DNA methylase, partial [Acidobacteriota bacterium]
MNPLRGIGGTLLPGRYLADRLERDAAEFRLTMMSDRRVGSLGRWWLRVDATCGPASGIRTIFDVVAMPLFGMLGFRAHDVVFPDGRAEARLETRVGVSVGLIVLPWASGRSSLWRDLIVTARAMRVSWCFLFAPPFLSLVDTRGHAIRRSVDFTFPEAVDAANARRFLALVRPEMFEPHEPGKAIAGMEPGGATSLLDRVVALATEFQDSVREDLQQGVTSALGFLGGALERRNRPDRDHRDNGARLDEALTIVYRILFLLFAESRDLVPHEHPIYRRTYAVAALAREAQAPGFRAGLWEGLAAVTRLSRIGCRTSGLVVRPFNGKLFARAAAPSLESPRHERRSSATLKARDVAMQQALVALASRPGRAGREGISFADLGVEQLGAVYERVLDLDPGWLDGDGPSAGRRSAGRGERHDAAGQGLRHLHAAISSPAAWQRGQMHSTRRKRSGTFYTPRPLAEFVVRRTLAPLVAGASTDTILALRVLDPAMGSGAFLVAACHYLAQAYERALVDEGGAASGDLDEDGRANIRRLIAERCLAGVDRNPVAVQLARLSLWLTTLARGKPLGFLDHRLRVGNSLIGASPEDVRRLPERRRRSAASAQLSLFDTDLLEDALRQAAGPLGEIGARRDETVDDVRAKERLWRQVTSRASPLHQWRAAANVWCARWFGPPGRPVPSSSEHAAILDAVLKGDRVLPASHLAERLSASDAAAAEHAFFHWPLEFADVFYDAHGRGKPRAGFDAVVGNPPWEMLRQEPRRDRTRESGAELERTEMPGRGALIRFIRESGLYPSCDRGHVNLYQPFLERALSIARPAGRVGLVLPWGLASDEGTTRLRARLIASGGIDTLVGLDNADGLFP